MRESPKQHIWFYTRQSLLNGGEQGPYTEQQMIELATLGKIKLDTLLRSPTRTQNKEILAESIPKLALAINQAEIVAEAKRQADYDERKKEQKALAGKKRAAEAVKQKLVRRKENEIEGYLEIPIYRTQNPTQSNKSTIDFSKLEEYSSEYQPISVRQKLRTAPLAAKSLSVLAISSFLVSVPGLCCFPVGIVAIVLGIFGTLEINNPLKRKYGMPLAIPGIVLGILSLFVFLAIVAKRPDSFNRINLVGNESTKVDPRRAWICISYKSVYTQKDERTWIETDSETGKIKFEMDYKGRTDDYVELLNVAKNDLVRLYADRIEVKQDREWAAIGGGHWDPVNQNRSVATQAANEKQNQTKIATEKNNLSSSDPFLRTIRGNTWFGTRSSDQYQKLLSMSIHGDSEAFSKELIGLILAGDAVMFKDGEQVFLRPSFSLLMMKVRRKGDTAEYWTDTSATN